MSFLKGTKKKLKLEADKLKELTLKEKFEYFCDYYLGTTVVTIIVIALIIGVIVTFVKNSREVVLNVTVVQENIVDAETMNATLCDVFDVGSDEQIVLDGGNFLFNEQGLVDSTIYEKICTRFFSGDMDIYIGTKADVDIFSNSQYFADISKILDEDLYNRLLSEDLIYMGTTTLTDDEGDTYIQETPVGIIINGSDFCQKANITLEPTILCVSKTSVRTENAVKFIEYVLE